MLFPKTQADGLQVLTLLACDTREPEWALVAHKYCTQSPVSPLTKTSDNCPISPSLYFPLMENGAMIAVRSSRGGLNEVSGWVTCQRTEMAIFKGSPWCCGAALIFKEKTVLELEAHDLFIQKLLIQYVM